jgi:hypothetical protein
MRLWLPLLFFTLFWSQGAFSLAIGMQIDQNEKLAYVTLIGPIERGDDSKFRELVLPQLRRNVLIFEISVFSSGGDVATAMALGEQIRTLQTRTISPYYEAVIRNNQKVATGKTSCTIWEWKQYGMMPRTDVGKSWCECASACFLVWASGAVREGGRMGIHRLYWPGTDFGNLPPAEARVRYKKAQDTFTAYLTKLDVPQSMIDRLFATDSHSMYYLSWPEMQLMQSTPFVEEMTYSRCGKSKKESMSAKNNWTMREDPEHIECYRSILKQLMQDGARDYLAKYGP